MLEVLIWSLFVGSLGIDAVLVSGWLRWQEKVVKTQEEEEEEILSNHESQDKLTGDNISSMNSGRSPKRFRSSSSLSVDNHSRTKSSRPLPQPAARKIPAQREKSPELSRSQPQTVLHPSPPTPSHLDPVTLPHHNTVNGLDRTETTQQPLDIPSQKITEWEYKIVRANYDLFRNSTNFMRLCEEESQAGWILLEKLDDRRVRFKRSVAMRDKIDVNQLPFDPYRCHYGPNNAVINFFGAIAAVTAMVLPAYLGYTLVSHTLQESTSKNSQTQAPLELINPIFQPAQIP